MISDEIRVGKGPNIDYDQILSFKDSSTLAYEVNFIGISTADGYNGTWEFSNSIGQVGKRKSSAVS